MGKVRLDILMARRGLVASRSQAENYIKLGKVRVNGLLVTKPGHLTSLNEAREIKIDLKEQYVSRAALKLESVINTLGIDFKNRIVLDVGSSTGGFSQVALNNKAKRVIAVEKGTNQMNSLISSDSRLALHEKTDIRNFKPADDINIVLIDVSFVSLRELLPYIRSIVNKDAVILAMVKPQFEAKESGYKHKGVIKNEKIRRQIFKDFEAWASKLFIIKGKSDSEVSGSKGNRERFYALKKLST